MKFRGFILSLITMFCTIGLFLVVTQICTWRTAMVLKAMFGIDSYSAVAMAIMLAMILFVVLIAMLIKAYQSYREASELHNA